MVGASGSGPKMGVRPVAPTIETIVSLSFYAIIKRISYLKRPETPKSDGVSVFFYLEEKGGRARVA
jgi:hypothetical protein